MTYQAKPSIFDRPLNEARARRREEAMIHLSKATVYLTDLRRLQGTPTDHPISLGEIQSFAKNAHAELRAALAYLDMLANPHRYGDAAAATRAALGTRLPEEADDEHRITPSQAL